MMSGRVSGRVYAMICTCCDVPVQVRMDAVSVRSVSLARSWMQEVGACVAMAL